MSVKRVGDVMSKAKNESVGVSVVEAWLGRVRPDLREALTTPQVKATTTMNDTRHAVRWATHETVALIALIEEAVARKVAGAIEAERGLTP